MYCLLNNKRGENLKETLSPDMKRITGMPETDFRGFFKDLSGINEYNYPDYEEDDYQESVIKKAGETNNISEKEMRQLLESLTLQKKFADKLFNHLIKRGKIKFGNSQDSKKQLENVRTQDNTIQKNVEEIQREERL